MIKIKDATGKILTLKNTPQKIVSLVPSQTHLLWKLGLEREVAGITRFCKYPEHWKKSKRIVGGTKDVKIDRILALNPDLILANKEENTKETVEKLAAKFPVYVAEVVSWNDNLAFIADVGKMTGKTEKALEIISGLKNLKLLLKKHKKSQKVLYFIWRNPFMLAGNNTFIHTMLHLLGFQNEAVKLEGRYPVLTEENMALLSPELILLSSEPYPFKEKHRDEIQKLFPRAEIKFVDGEPFTWFGAYPLEAGSYLLNCCGG